MKKLHMLVLAICTSVVLSNAQIGAKTQQAKIHGIWQNNGFGYQMTLMLNSDGTGEFDGESITFSVQANKLTIKQGSETNTYTFALQNNALTLSGGDLEQSITFTRSGTSNSPATETVATQPVSPNQPAHPGAPAMPALIGSWSNYSETIEFKSNGQCTYLGQTYPYSVSGNYVTLQTSQGNVMMVYSVSGNQLSLTMNGQNLVYNKGQAGSSHPGSSQTSGNNKLDLTLVGKWCYVNVTSTNTGGTSTDACITINGDGTYSYYSERSMSANTSTFSAGTASQNSDSGTWWVEGGRIYYNSQTQGQGSYQLIKQNHPKTGDPMIILDGTSYVTYFQKSPW